MRDPVIVQAIRTSHRQRQADRALAGVHPVDSISRDVRPALGADLTTPLPAATASSHPDHVVRRHAR